MNEKELKHYNTQQLYDLIIVLDEEKATAYRRLKMVAAERNKLLEDNNSLKKERAKSHIENIELKEIVRTCFIRDNPTYPESNFEPRGFVGYVLKHIFIYKLDKQCVGIIKN